MKSILLILAILLTSAASVSLQATKKATISGLSPNSKVASPLQIEFLSSKEILLGFDISATPFCSTNVKLSLLSSDLFLPTYETLTIELINSDKWFETNATWNNAKLASFPQPTKFNKQLTHLTGKWVFLDIDPIYVNSAIASGKISFRISSKSFFSSMSFTSANLTMTQNSTYCVNLNDTQKCQFECSRSPLCQDLQRCQKLLNYCTSSDALNVTISCINGLDYNRKIYHMVMSRESISTLKYWGTNEGGQGSYAVYDGTVKNVVGESYINSGGIFLFDTETEGNKGPDGTVWFSVRGQKAVGFKSVYSSDCQIVFAEGVDRTVFNSNGCSSFYVESGLYRFEYRLLYTPKTTSCNYGNSIITINSRAIANNYEICNTIIASQVIINGNWETSEILEYVTKIQGSLVINTPTFKGLKRLQEVTGSFNVTTKFGDTMKVPLTVWGPIYIDALGSTYISTITNINIDKLEIINANSVSFQQTQYINTLVVKNVNLIQFISLSKVGSAQILGVEGGTGVSVKDLALSTSFLYFDNVYGEFESLQVIQGDFYLKSQRSTFTFSPSVTVYGSVDISIEGETLNIFSKINMNGGLKLHDMPNLKEIKSEFSGDITNLELTDMPKLSLVLPSSFVNLSCQDILIKNTSLTTLKDFSYKSNKINSLIIVNNPKLISLQGLEALQTIDKLNISYNFELTEESLKPLNYLRNCADLYIRLTSGREYFSIIQPCQCSMAGFACNVLLGSGPESFDNKTKLYKAYALVKLPPKNYQKSIYLSRSLICMKELTPQNQTQIDTLVELLTIIGKEADLNGLNDISFKSASYMNAIIQGPVFSSYVPPYSPEFLLERAEKHLEFISSSVSYYEELGTQKMTLNSIEELIELDFQDNNILINNLQNQYKQIQDKIKKDIASMEKAVNVMEPLTTDIETAVRELETQIEEEAQKNAINILLSCFKLGLSVLKFCVTFDVTAIPDAVGAFSDLANDAIDFYNDNQGAEEFPDFDKIFLTLDQIWPQLEEVTYLVDKLDRLISSNGSIESIENLLSNSKYSLVADWKSLPVYVRRSLINICSPLASEDILIPCNVLIDTLEILSVYGEDITELSKSLSDSSRQGTLVNSGLQDYNEAKKQLIDLQKNFDNEIAAAELARLVADRHLANLVTITIGEIQEFCFSARYVFPGSTIDGCNIEDVAYNGGQTLVDLQTLFLQIYASQKVAMLAYLDQQSVGVPSVNLTDRINWDLLLSGERVWFSVDRSLDFPQYFTNGTYYYLEVSQLVFYLKGLPVGTNIQFDFTLNPPFYKDDKTNVYSYSIEPFVDNLLQYKVVESSTDCAYPCDFQVADADAEIYLCVCTNADFGMIDSKDLFIRPSLFSRMSLKITNIYQVLDSINTNSVNADNFELFVSMNLKAQVQSP